MIVTPNIEQIETEGGLDDLLASILVQAEKSKCPVVFALSRKKLGQVYLSQNLSFCRHQSTSLAQKVPAVPGSSLQMSEENLDILASKACNDQRQSVKDAEYWLQVFGCRKKMSAIAILDYAGAEVLFKQMEQHAEQGRREWELNNKEASPLQIFPARQAYHRAGPQFSSLHYQFSKSVFKVA